MWYLWPSLFTKECHEQTRCISTRRIETFQMWYLWPSLFTKECHEQTRCIRTWSREAFQMWYLWPHLFTKECHEQTCCIRTWRRETFQMWYLWPFIFSQECHESWMDLGKKLLPRPQHENFYSLSVISNMRKNCNPNFRSFHTKWIRLECTNCKAGTM